MENHVDISKVVRQHLEMEQGLAGFALRGEPAESEAENQEDRMVVAQKAAELEKIAEEVRQCCKCGLNSSRTNAVPGEGNPDARIMFVGEAPGADEDAQGRPFVGRAGQLLDKIVAACGLERSDVFIGNILKCRPPENRDPRADEIISCLPYLQRQIEIIEPEVIVALGGDGFMLQTLHRFMNADKRIYGMNRGSVGFLMNDYREDGLRERIATETRTARVVARDISPSFRVVRLAVDQGEQAGLHAGMPVVANEGLVGQIRRVSGGSADVLLTIDPESRVDVVVGKGRARGRLEGLDGVGEVAGGAGAAVEHLDEAVARGRVLAHEDSRNHGQTLVPGSVHELEVPALEEGSALGGGAVVALGVEDAAQEASHGCGGA